MNADYRETDIYGPGLDIEKYRSDVDKTLRKTFKHDLVGRFEKAVVQYQLVEEGDRIAVCISGGKDSMLMAKLFQELKRHNKFPFSLVFLSMDPGYLPENRNLIEKNAELLGIPLEICGTNIFDAVYTIEKSPCYLCARMRRGYLYRFAKEHGCNKIALGHHYDDVIETILMGMLYSGQYQGMMPKLRSTNFEGLELIRPYLQYRTIGIPASMACSSAGSGSPFSKKACSSSSPTLTAPSSMPYPQDYSSRISAAR